MESSAKVVGKAVEAGVNAFMYNLVTDPTESSNLYDKPAYADGQTYFEARMGYYKDLVVAPSLPVSDDMYTTWKKNGGLTPWVETKLKSGPIGKKYSYSDAPHIVFMLVDDWGWNDVGYHSTSMAWTTPNIDALAADGIKLENHYSHELCSPSRGALLTGRYAMRLGLWEQQDADPFAELPLTETTLAQELKSAGYETYMVGKWDLGFSTTMHNPTNRGFDFFYGYYSSFVDYWTKEHNGYLDLQDGENLVTDAAATDKTKHNAYLMQEKFEEYVDYHAKTYPLKPMFMYYSTQLIHGPWSAPSTYTERCGVPWKIADPRIQLDTQNYCALNLMLDEIVANVTCKLKAKNMAENTVLVIVSDNGGEKTVSGNSYPFKGHKGAYQRGGTSTTAIIHSSLVELNKRGSSYTGTMHISDWLPTLMHVATAGAWEGSLSGAELDGVDLWQAITTTKNTVQHDEIPFYVAQDGSASVIQRGAYRYYYNMNDNPVDEPEYVFEYDLQPTHSYKSCVSIVMTGEDIHPKVCSLRTTHTHTVPSHALISTRTSSCSCLFSGGGPDDDHVPLHGARRKRHEFLRRGGELATARQL
jgi:arylsulfatase A-like enzyme